MTDRILPNYTSVLTPELEEAIGIALGRASVCWDPMDCTGVFQSDVASQLTDELVGVARQFASSFWPKEIHNEDTLNKVWKALALVGLKENQIINAVMRMQNDGILFREVSHVG